MRFLTLKMLVLNAFPRLSGKLMASFKTVQKGQVYVGLCHSGISRRRIAQRGKKHRAFSRKRPLFNGGNTRQSTSLPYPDYAEDMAKKPLLNSSKKSENLLPKGI